VASWLDGPKAYHRVHRSAERALPPHRSAAHTTTVHPVHEACTPSPRY